MSYDEREPPSEPPPWWDIIPISMQRLLVSKYPDQFDESWISESIYAPEWANQWSNVREFGWMMPSSLAPFYAETMLERGLRSGALQGAEYAWTYQGRYEMAQAGAADYARRLQGGGADWQKSYWTMQMNLGQARGAYYQFQQQWTPIAEAWSAARLASFMMPQYTPIRIFGFPFFGLVQNVASAAVMAPDIQQAIAADPTHAMQTLLHGPPSGLTAPFQFEPFLGALGTGLGEWTLLQSAFWQVTGRGGGLQTSLGINLMQGGLGLMMNPISVLASRAAAGVRPGYGLGGLFENAAEERNALMQIGVGAAWAAGGFGLQVSAFGGGWPTWGAAGNLSTLGQAVGPSVAPGMWRGVIYEAPGVTMDIYQVGQGAFGGGAYSLELRDPRGAISRFYPPRVGEERALTERFWRTQLTEREAASLAAQTSFGRMAGGIIGAVGGFVTGTLTNQYILDPWLAAVGKAQRWTPQQVRQAQDIADPIDIIVQTLLGQYGGAKYLAGPISRAVSGPIAALAMTGISIPLAIVTGQQLVDIGTQYLTMGYMMSPRGTQETRNLVSTLQGLPPEQARAAIRALYRQNPTYAETVIQQAAPGVPSWLTGYRGAAPLWQQLLFGEGLAIGAGQETIGGNVWVPQYGRRDVGWSAWERYETITTPEGKRIVGLNEILSSYYRPPDWYTSWFVQTETPIGANMPLWQRFLQGNPPTISTLTTNYVVPGPGVAGWQRTYVGNAPVWDLAGGGVSWWQRTYGGWAPQYERANIPANLEINRAMMGQGYASILARYGTGPAVAPINPITGLPYYDTTYVTATSRELREYSALFGGPFWNPITSEQIWYTPTPKDIRQWTGGNMWAGYDYEQRVQYGSMMYALSRVTPKDDMLWYDPLQERFWTLDPITGKIVSHAATQQGRVVDRLVGMGYNPAAALSAYLAGYGNYVNPPGSRYMDVGGGQMAYVGPGESYQMSATWTQPQYVGQGRGGFTRQGNYIYSVLGGEPRYMPRGMYPEVLYSEVHGKTIMTATGKLTGTVSTYAEYLYGQAYGNWIASGMNPNFRPDRSDFTGGGYTANYVTGGGHGGAPPPFGRWAGIQAPTEPYWYAGYGIPRVTMGAPEGLGAAPPWKAYSQTYAAWKGDVTKWYAKKYGVSEHEAAKVATRYSGYQNRSWQEAQYQARQAQYAEEAQYWSTVPYYQWGDPHLKELLFGDLLYITLPLPA